MLEKMTNQTPLQNRDEMISFYRVYLSLLNIQVPTIAAINGYAMGAGLSFSLGCDIRLASRKAKIGVTFLNINLHPGMGTTYLLPKIAGTGNASDLIFTGRIITAEEAFKMNIVDRVVEHGELLESAFSLADMIKTKSMEALRLTKSALLRYKIKDLEDALQYEATAQMNSYASDEMRESLRLLKANLAAKKK